MMRRFATLFSIVATIAGAGVGATAAQAETGPLGGTVLNGTGKSLRIASLQGGSICKVVDPLKLWKGHFQNRCTWKTLPAHRWSKQRNTGYYMHDVDALGFASTHWYYNGLYVRSGAYVKIRDFQVVRCYKAPFFAPRCQG